MTKMIVNIPPVQLRPEMFTNLINLVGMPLRWEKATMCSCVRADLSSGTPTFNCGVCYNGNVYIDSVDLTGVITNIAGQRNAQIFGELAIGGVFIVVDGQYRLGINDRITMLNQTARYSEMVDLPVKVTTQIANPGDPTLTLKDTRKFPTPDATPAQVLVNGQTLTYTGKTQTTLTGIPATGVGAITDQIASGSNVQAMDWELRYAPITIFDARNLAVTMTQDVDFRILDGKRIQLLNPGGLPKYTVLYDSQPVYLVDSLSHEFRDQMTKVGYPVGSPVFTRLPVSAVARKDFIRRIG